MIFVKTTLDKIPEFCEGCNFVKIRYDGVWCTCSNKIKMNLAEYILKDEHIKRPNNCPLVDGDGLLNKNDIIEKITHKINQFDLSDYEDDRTMAVGMAIIRDIIAKENGLLFDKEEKQNDFCKNKTKKNS